MELKMLGTAGIRFRKIVLDGPAPNGMVMVKLYGTVQSALTLPVNGTEVELPALGIAPGNLKITYEVHDYDPAAGQVGQTLGVVEENFIPDPVPAPAPISVGMLWGRTTKATKWIVLLAAVACALVVWVVIATRQDVTLGTISGMAHTPYTIVQARHGVWPFWRSTTAYVAVWDSGIGLNPDVRIIPDTFLDRWDGAKDGAVIELPKEWINWQFAPAKAVAQFRSTFGGNASKWGTMFIADSDREVMSTVHASPKILGMTVPTK